MVTPRGHTNKYRLDDGSVLDGQRPAQSLRTEGSLAERFAGSGEPEPKLNITQIKGAFMRSTTELYEDEPEDESSSDLESQPEISETQAKEVKEPAPGQWFRAKCARCNSTPKSTCASTYS